MAARSSLRASDADRDAVAERLRQAAVEGRLDADELEERLHAALRSRTYGELDRLLADLPPKSLAAPPRTAVPAVRTAAAVAVRVLALLAILTIVAVGAVLTAAWWLMWVVFWIALRAHGGGGCARRAQRGRHGGPAWHRPPHMRRI
jgi:hypothetical protein